MNKLQIVEIDMAPATRTSEYAETIAALAALPPERLAKVGIPDVTVGALQSLRIHAAKAGIHLTARCTKRDANGDPVAYTVHRVAVPSGKGRKRKETTAPAANPA